MARKPNSMYRKITQQAYTRREYMGGVPMARIQQFDQGEIKGVFTHMITLVADEQCQIRHTAMDSARVVANKYIEKMAGKANYYMKFRIFPHFVLRENKQATGAGADRVSQGMRRAFGKPIGTAARVYPGHKLMTIKVNEAHVTAAKEALRKASNKFPTPCHIVVEPAPKGHL